ncbi:MAG TPA: glycosyl hydrolase, partial [Clostridiales bacterium]|nr:glycosyl hydrolase [Clostridiales bacterium]
VIRPVKELRDFYKVELKPGEKKTVEFVLGKRAFAYYNTKIKDWHVETGEFDILVGQSSRNIKLKKSIQVESTVKLPYVYTMDTTIGDLIKDEKAQKIIAPFMEMDVFTSTESESEVATAAISKEMIEAMMQYMPLRGVLSFGDGKITIKDLEGIIDKLNKEI